MSAHQHDARETPTMTELLAACAAANAVSTPPGADEESGKTAESRKTAEPRKQGPAGSADEPAAEDENKPVSTQGRDAA
ncbi:hypothetical protein ACFW1M_07230 [Streptomyces inhibens]|uniref:hypothetical protein n=1 Tax=Streptomyces inhibens TaxID=2293571 RepID=UPI003692592D